MGDMAEDFRAMREYSREQRSKRYAKNIAFLDKVTGFEREDKTPYQIRFSHPDVGEFVDLYPTNQRYHNLKTGKRGRYKTAQGFLELTLLQLKEDDQWRDKQ